MKFFTDKTVINEYLLVKIGDYLKIKDFTQWKEVFIDPGVYELTKGPTYSWESKIKILDFLNTLPENHYFTCDYPCDMNEGYTQTFLMKSWDNAVKYCAHPNYIVVVQSKLNDYWSFREWFDRYNELPIASGILGLGNMCRILHVNEFVKTALPYAFKNCKHHRIHIYGLSIRHMKFAYKLAEKYRIELSVDSTKWTRACSTELRDKYYPKTNCTKINRQEFFDEYKNSIRKRGIRLEGCPSKVGLQNDYVDK